MPLSDAFYLASTDKIYGVMSNYILKFNASTGAKEDSARICAPMHGPMRIVGIGGTLYVASQFDLTDTDFGGSSNRTIWSVDATTLAVTNVLGVNAKRIGVTGNEPIFAGPNVMFAAGNLLYFQWSYASGLADYNYINVVSPGTYVINQSNGTSNNWSPETLAWDGDSDPVNGRIHACDPAQNEGEIYRLNITVGAYQGKSKTVPDSPVAVAYASNVGLAYSVCGNESLYSHSGYSIPGVAATLHNLITIAPNCAPTRIRYINGLLYIPCQKTDIVIVWNPISDTGIVKSGFDSPIDVIWTGTKLWAVQTSIQSFKEIV